MRVLCLSGRDGVPECSRRTKMDAYATWGIGIQKEHAQRLLREPTPHAGRTPAASCRSALFLCLRLLHGELEHNVFVGDLLVHRREGVELGLHVHLFNSSIAFVSEARCAHREKRVRHQNPIGNSRISGVEDGPFRAIQAGLRTLHTRPRPETTQLAWFGSTRA